MDHVVKLDLLDRKDRKVKSGLLDLEDRKVKVVVVVEMQPLRVMLLIWWNKQQVMTAQGDQGTLANFYAEKW